MHASSEDACPGRQVLLSGRAIADVAVAHTALSTSLPQVRFLRSRFPDLYIEVRGGDATRPPTEGG